MQESEWQEWLLDTWSDDPNLPSSSTSACFPWQWSVLISAAISNRYAAAVQNSVDKQLNTVCEKVLIPQLKVALKEASDTSCTTSIFVPHSAT